MTTTHPVIAPKKLIEVALPLDAINEAAARTRKCPDSGASRGTASSGGRGDR